MLTGVSSLVLTDWSKATGVLLSDPGTNVVCESNATLKLRLLAGDPVVLPSWAV